MIQEGLSLAATVREPGTGEALWKLRASNSRVACPQLALPALPKESSMRMKGGHRKIIWTHHVPEKEAPLYGVEYEHREEQVLVC